MGWYLSGYWLKEREKRKEKKRKKKGVCVWERAGKRTSLQKCILELVLKSEMSLWRVNKCIRWLMLGGGEGEEDKLC